MTKSCVLAWALTISKSLGELLSKRQPLFFLVKLQFFMEMLEVWLTSSTAMKLTKDFYNKEGHQVGPLFQAIGNFILETPCSDFYPHGFIWWPKVVVFGSKWSFFTTEKMTYMTYMWQKHGSFYWLPLKKYHFCDSCTKSQTWLVAGLRLLRLSGDVDHLRLDLRSEIGHGGPRNFRVPRDFLGPFDDRPQDPFPDFGCPFFCRQ